MSIILGSASPRRSELLKWMGIPFSVLVKDTKEDFPNALFPREVAIYVSEKKASAFFAESLEHTIITADTVVCLDNQLFGKPSNDAEAQCMLEQLSGRAHEVVTAVTIVVNGQLSSFFDTTTVFFRKLLPKEISFYIERYQPLDKAGAYGIQEWIGVIGIERIEGSYTNVMGLPTGKLFNELKNRALLSQ